MGLRAREAGMDDEGPGCEQKKNEEHFGHWLGGSDL